MLAFERDARRHRSSDSDGLRIGTAKQIAAAVDVDQKKLGEAKRIEARFFAGRRNDDDAITAQSQTSDKLQSIRVAAFSTDKLAIEKDPEQ